MCIPRATVSAVSCLVVPAFICIDLLISRVLKINDDDDDEICEPLTIILQRSTDEGSVPDDWRNANISPIYKKGDKAQAANYRPVSLTSQISKLCESLIRGLGRISGN